MDEISRKLKMEPHKLREKNFYKGRLGMGEAEALPSNHFQQELVDCETEEIWAYCMDKSNFLERKKNVDKFNTTHKYRKRGVYMMPVKFGVSFGQTFLNQGSALVHCYQDGLFPSFLYSYFFFRNRVGVTWGCGDGSRIAY